MFNVSAVNLGGLINGIIQSYSLSNQKLADELEIGIGTIARWRSGKVSMISPSAANILASYLKITVPELITRLNQPTVSIAKENEGQTKKMETLRSLLWQMDPSFMPEILAILSNVTREMIKRNPEQQMTVTELIQYCVHTTDRATICALLSVGGIDKKRSDAISDGAKPQENELLGVAYMIRMVLCKNLTPLDLKQMDMR